MNTEEISRFETAAEARYRTTLVSIGDGVISTDAQGRVDLMNPVAERLTGWSEAAARAKPLDDVFRVVDEKTRAVAESLVVRILREGQAVELANHNILISKNGPEFPIVGNGAPICDANGATTGVVLVFHDQTEEHQARAEIVSSETRYRRLFEAAQDGILILDVDTGKIVDVNPFLMELTGYSREDFLAKHLWEIGPFKDTADCKDSFAKLLTEKYVRYDDLPLKAKDGRKVAVEFVSNVYRVDNQNVIQCNIRDITERKEAENALRESEERYKALFDGSLDLVYLSDLEGRFVDANAAALNRLGYTRDEIVHLSFASLLSEDQLPAAFLSLQEIVQTGAQRAANEFRIKRKDGSDVFVESTGSAVFSGGKMVAIQGIARDITARKRAETAREMLEEQLRASQRMDAIGSLAGGVAHDFNNLLSVILSYTGFAMDGMRDGDPLKEDLLEVKKAGGRAAALTRQLLAFSRKQVLQPVALSLNQSATSVEKMLQRILGEDIDLVQKLSPDLGLTLADPGQIDQVLMNLVVNARDAMPEGGKLTIETSNVEIDEEYAARHVSVKPGSYVQLAVSDTGYGMDEQTRARIFEPFYTTKEKGKGTGLGLSTVYGIVKQSGGNIWVYSELGLGTTFKVYLPRDHSATTATDIKPPTVKKRATGTETILVVEDEEALRKVALRTLGAAGYTVLAASDGDDALLKSTQHAGDIHLLLTDVVMPRMSGRVLAQNLLRARPAIKVLYMSGYTDDAIVHHGVLDAGTQFLAKPFTAADLARKVREVLDEGTARVAGGREPAARDDAELEEQPFDKDSPRGLPADLLSKLRRAVTAARYDELIELIETIRMTEPEVAAGLRRMADRFDYDGLRNLLGGGGGAES